MRTVRTIAILSFREAIRDRILYTLFFFCLLMMGMSRIIESMVMAQRAQIIKDIGLGAISIIGLSISIIIGVKIFSKELRKFSGYALLSKPVLRGHLLLGKYMGVLLTLGVILSLMGSILMLSAAVSEGKFDPYLFVGINSILLELSVLIAFTLLFSTFCPPFSSGVLTFVLYALGHLISLLKSTFSIDSSILSHILNGLFLLIPDLERFNLKSDIVYHTLPPWQYLMSLILYGFIYVSVALFLSWLVIRKKDMQ